MSFIIVDPPAFAYFLRRILYFYNFLSIKGDYKSVRIVKQFSIILPSKHTHMHNILYTH